MANSPVIGELWEEVARDHRDLFVDIMGYDPFTDGIAALKPTLARRVMTIGLWLNHRIGRRRRSGAAAPTV
jgi:hypothetical protein